MKQTAIYSGSFNPLHIGHLEILRHLVRDFDRVLLVVSPRNPLKSEYPQSELWLIIGGDQLSDFRRWKDYPRILLNHGICVFPRQGYDLPALADDLQNENPNYRIRLMDMPLVNISSTQIREALSRGEDLSGLLM